MPNKQIVINKITQMFVNLESYNCSAKITSVTIIIMILLTQMNQLQQLQA